MPGLPSVAAVRHITSEFVTKLLTLLPFISYQLQAPTTAKRRGSDMTFTKKAIAGFALFGALAVPGIALAATSSADINDYLNQPRTTAAASEVGAQNGSGAGSGAFGYLGKDNNKAGGADGTKTGLANSAVAGNRQGNLPATP